jgi:hypothetical protein
MFVTSILNGDALLGVRLIHEIALQVGTTPHASEKSTSRHAQLLFHMDKALIMTMCSVSEPDII